jgi:tetratricopeptide (TPR) repeat protein/predicted Ser/Thr protein kinase
MSELPERIGRYEILEEVGRGGMGVVYKARDPNIDRLVALKVIRLSFDDDEDTAAEMRERFRREARAAGVLQHPNIVTVFDAGEDEGEGTSFIAMEYVEGTTLDRITGPDEMLPINRINSIVRHVARGLAYAHENGVIHRDIKLANILVTSDGVAKIMDFGIARLSDSDLTQQGVVMGSPSYMSPEQVTGQQIDHRSDIFSLGVILYQLLTGERPFPGENPTVISYRIVRVEPPEVSELNPLVPPAYDRILKKALAKRPEDRYETAERLAEDLERVSEGGDVTEAAHGAGTLTAPGEGLFGPIFDKTWARWAALAVAVAVFFAGLVFISLKLSNPYNEVYELIETGQHEQATLELLKLRAHKPKDHRIAYLLGREYKELRDYKSSIKAYASALLLHPYYRSDDKLQEDLIAALSRPEADLAIQLIVSKVGAPVKKKLKASLEDPDYNLHWNAAEALRGLGEEVDEFPLLVLDLKYNPDCKRRRAAVERMGDLRNTRALPELELTKGDRRNTWACMGLAIEQAEEKIHEANPEDE